MVPTTFQTVRLGPGKHRSAEEGACVMELSSMLAGEPFGDRPASVSPVIGALLRPYNDLAGEHREQLRACASAVVGTCASAEVERRRLNRCAAEIDELTARGRGPARLLRQVRAYPPTPRALQRIVATDPVSEQALDAFGCGLIRLLAQPRRGWHDRVVALVLELAAIGSEDHPDRMMRPGPADTTMASSSDPRTEHRERP